MIKDNPLTHAYSLKTYHMFHNMRVSHYCSFFENQLLPRNAQNAISKKFSTMKITSAENTQHAQYLNMITSMNLLKTTVKIKEDIH